MSPITEEIAMAHKLSPAKQNAMLAKCAWEPGSSRLRVTCTHNTAPLLRMAGISCPRPCETYLVPAIRDQSGFLVVDTEARAASAEMGELFKSGGLLHGIDQNGHFAILQGDDSMRVENAGMIEETKALIHGHGRRFEVSTGPHSKIRLLIIAMDDEALPSPSERELWTSRNPTDREVVEAAHALVVASSLDHFRR